MELPFHLLSALNLSGSKNSICVPLFLRYPENFLYVGVCDQNLRIVNFQPLIEFERFHVPITVEPPIPVSYAVGDITPLVVIAGGKTHLFHADNTQQLLEMLEAASENDDDIFFELKTDIQKVSFESIQLSINDSEIDHRKLDGQEFEPRPARLWLDETVRNIRLSKSGRSLDESEASQTRLKLLNWAKQYGENAHSILFKHFVDLIGVMEGNGVFARDILAVALIRRISEEIERQHTATNLVSDFRARYTRSPGAFAVELANKDDGPFSSRAREVINDFYEKSYQLILQNNFPKLLVYAYAIDNDSLWSERIQKILNERIETASQRLHSMLDSEMEIFNNLQIAREKLIQDRKIYRAEDDKLLTDLHEIKNQMLNTKNRISQATQFIDTLLKVRDGVKVGSTAIEIAKLNYKRLGLNPSFFDALDKELDIDTT